MKSINVTGVFHEAEYADSRTCTICLVSVGYFTIPYTSTFIRLFHFYQECHVHCIVITIDGGMDSVGGG